MEYTLRVGSYRLVERLAVGGMGEIFLAEADGPYFARKVVLKRILPHLIHDTQHVNRFIDEARLMTQLHHGNILSVYELKQDDWGLYMVMEYIPSVDVRTINRWLTQVNQSWPSIYAAWVVAEICEALSYAHNKQNQQGEDLGIIHRDISPSNLLVGLAGEVKLIDFGVAQAHGSLHQSVAGTLQGKLCYLSPEQARGETVNAQSDLYALALILYEMLSGKRALEGLNDADVLHKAQNADFLSLHEVSKMENLALDLELCEIVQQSLHPNLAQRTSDASILAHQLRDWIQKQSQSNLKQGSFDQHQLQAWLLQLKQVHDSHTNILPVTLDLNQVLQAQFTDQVEYHQSSDQVEFPEAESVSTKNENHAPQTASIVIQPPLRFIDAVPKLNNQQEAQEISQDFEAIWNQQLTDEVMVDPSAIQIDQALHVSVAEIIHQDSDHHESAQKEVHPLLMWSRRFYIAIVVMILMSAFMWSVFKNKHAYLAIAFETSSPMQKLQDLKISVDQEPWSWTHLWSLGMPIEVCVSSDLFDQCQWVMMQKLPLLSSFSEDQTKNVWHYDLKKNIQKGYPVHVMTMKLKPKTKWFKQLSSVSTTSSSIQLTGKDMSPAPKKSIPNDIQHQPEVKSESKPKSKSIIRSKLKKQKSRMVKHKSIHITATPPEAKLHCKNKTPQELPYYAKINEVHTCSIQAKGYRTQVIKKVSKSSYHTDLQAFSIITVRALPRSAKLYINKKAMKNPLKAYQVPAGKHHIQAIIKYQNQIKSKHIELDLKPKQKVTKVIDLSDLLNP